MSGRVAGKVAVVTGAARGIGRGCAEMLAREGARVAIGDIDFSALERTAKEVSQVGSEALSLTWDLKGLSGNKSLIFRSR